ncbi:MAG: tripartite tricarboxylate transporter TctB family protein [Pseudomonadota bacterium]
MDRRQDIVTGLIFMGLGIGAAWMAASYSGASGLYPMVLSVILTGLGALVALQAVRAGASSERTLVDAPAHWVTAVAAAAVYTALIVPLGFYTASFLLMLALPMALGFRRARYALSVAVIFMGLIFLVFTVLLEKPLPRELLPALVGAGG